MPSTQHPSASSRQRPLLLKFFGEFSVLRGETSPVFPYVKVRALLACLAAEGGREVQRSWLAALLWPELGETPARQNLRRALSSLRIALGDEEGERSCFRVSRTTLGLNPSAPIELDVAAFCNGPTACDLKPDKRQCDGCLQRMEAAVTAYRGELLAGFSLPDCPEFETWLQLRREQLHRHALKLLERLTVCHSTRGELVRALSFALRHAELDAWDDAAVRRVMQLYSATGQAGAALARFDTFSRLLEHDLGILPDQETRRLAAEIRRQVLPESAPIVVEPQAESAAPPELRQLTAVFCQLSLVDACGPDDAAELLPPLRAACVASLRSHGAYLVPTPGGTLGYFGFPLADERAALRAVQAARALVGLARPEGAQLRVGVHTGLAVGGGEAGVIDLSGETSALVMGLPARVEGGEIALSHPVFQLVATHFDARLLDEPLPGGSAAPPPVFRLLAEREVQPHPVPRSLQTPFAGRDEEMQRLRSLWQRALDGKAGLLLIAGDPGIGKSRLMRAFSEGTGLEAAGVITLSCQPESAHEALHPLSAMLAHALRLPGNLTKEDLGRHLQESLAGSSRLRSLGGLENGEVLSLIRWLLAVDDGAAAHPSPEDERRHFMSVLLRLVQDYASRHPLLVIIEDVHWADPSTLELIDAFARRARAGKLLVVVTARSSFVPLWPTDAFEQIALEPLSPPVVQQMIASIAGRAGLAPRDAERIADRVDGVPLFVEEVARMVVESGDAAVGIPHSLRDLLASRLGALGESRGLAQAAAVLGREFSVDTLSRVCGLTIEEARAGLVRLEAAGLVVGKSASSRFRHALIREAAYDSLSRASRQALHKRAVTALMNTPTQPGGVPPGILAHHFAAAGEPLQALEQHCRAADLALRHSACREVIGHLRQALSVLPLANPATGPAEGRQRMQEEFRILVQLGRVLGEVEGFGSQAARECYDRAFELCRTHGGTVEYFSTLLGLWRGSSSWSGYRYSLELSHQLLEIAEANRDEHQRALACYALGNVHCALGNLEDSAACLQRALVHYRPDMPVALYGDSAGIAAHAFLGWTLTLQGRLPQGLEHAVAATGLARRLEYPSGLCYALVFSAETYRLRGEPRLAQAAAREVVALAEQHGLATWGAFAQAFLGWAEVMLGEGDPVQMRDGLAGVGACLEMIRSSVMSGVSAAFYTLLAECALMAGEHALLEQTVAAALDFLEGNEGRHLEASLRLFLGESLLQRGRREEAAQNARQAAGVARKQGARLFEMRAQVLLLRAAESRPSHRSRLRKLLDGFDPDCPHPWSVEARALVQG